MEKTLRKVMLAGLLAIGFLNSACSTPVVPDKDPKSSDTTWWSYQSCLDSLPRGASASYCDNIDGEEHRSISYNEYLHGTGTQSTNQASYGNYTNYPATNTSNYGSSGPTYYGFTKAQGDTAYKAYLSALPKETQKKLAARWLELAEQAKAAQAAE